MGHSGWETQVAESAEKICCFIHSDDYDDVKGKSIEKSTNKQIIKGSWNNKVKEIIHIYTAVILMSMFSLSIMPIIDILENSWRTSFLMY